MKQTCLGTNESKAEIDKSWFLHDSVEISMVVSHMPINDPEPSSLGIPLTIPGEA